MSSDYNKSGKWSSTTYQIAIPNHFQSYCWTQEDVTNMQEKILASLMHALAVCINSAEAIRHKIKRSQYEAKRDNMPFIPAFELPKQSKRRDLNLSMEGLNNLQHARVKTEQGYTPLIDMLFTKSMDLVNNHTNQVLNITDINYEAYIALCLCIMLLVQKLEAMQQNKRRKSPEFWHYLAKTTKPLKPYYDARAENLASNIIDQLIKAIQ